MKTFLKPISELSPCPDALAWAEQYDTLAEVWAQCGRGDWMLWYLGKLAGPPESDSRKKLVLAACQCARLVLPCVPEGEPRPQRAIEVAEAWTRGEPGVTLEEVRHAAATNAAARMAILKQCADIVRQSYLAPPERGVE